MEMRRGFAIAFSRTREKYLRRPKNEKKRIRLAQAPSSLSHSTPPSCTWCINKKLLHPPFNPTSKCRECRRSDESEWARWEPWRTGSWPLWRWGKILPASRWPWRASGRPSPWPKSSFRGPGEGPTIVDVNRCPSRSPAGGKWNTSAVSPVRNVL